MNNFDPNRRKWLALVGAALSVALFPRQCFASRFAARPCVLILNNLNTGESLRSEFFNGENYDNDELARLNHFFRDYRASKSKSIDPQLFDQLYHLQTLLDVRKPVQLISGYRTLTTNNFMRSHTKGVAKHSYHTLGKAMDFNIEGISLSNIRKAALSLRAGGVGYYPNSNFVHIDTGPIRHW